MTSHTICKEGANPRIEVFRALLDTGSDVNAREIQGCTALHSLALDCFFDKEGYNMEAASLFLAGGADVSGKDGMGRTAADLLRRENTGLAQLLRSRMQGLHGLETVSNTSM